MGDPTLRPGQKVSVTGVVGTLPAGVTFVIRSVEHKFDSTKGYSCICVAAKKQDDGSLGPAIDAAFKPSAATAAQDSRARSRGRVRRARRSKSSRSFRTAKTTIGLTSSTAR